MKEYDPFSRGAFPVGVRTYEFVDPRRERSLPVECWYPAAESYLGRDLDRASQDRYLLMPGFPRMRQAAVRDAQAAGGVYPLVIFSHGLAGHRRQTTHFCTHLASHGYIVASMDHVGNTMPDILRLAMKAQKSGSLTEVMQALMDSAKDRPQDAIFTIDMMLAGEMRGRIDATLISITGHSFGGWTTLATLSREPRIKAALPLAPAGGKSELNPMANLFSNGLSLEFGREVPVLFLVADLDSLLPLDGMRDLFSRTPRPKNMVVLNNADHFHFCDNVEETHELFRKMGGLSAVLDPQSKAGPNSMQNARPSSELCPGQAAYTFLQGLGLAHIDAHLKGNRDAAALLLCDIEALMGKRRIKVEVVRG